jgi:pimeloyl-ACP methyl ester carboxylesterase
MHYRQLKNEAKPTLVLLHQAPSSSAMFIALMNELSGSYNIIAPDFPGFGDSDTLTETPTVALYAASVYIGLRQLNVERCFIFGHHSGTSVAMALTEIDDSLAVKIFMSGAALLTPELRHILPSKAEPISPQKNGSHFQSMWLRTALKDPAADTVLIEREVILATQMGIGYQQAYQAVADYDFAAAAKKLICPVMICAGTNDPLYGVMDDALALLKDGRKAEISGGTSYVCERNTVELAKLMHDFFNE